MLDKGEVKGGLVNVNVEKGSRMRNHAGTEGIAYLSVVA